MDKRCKKESTSRKTTAIKCSLNDVCVRKAIKPWINSRGQEAWVLDWSWHQAKGKKGLWRLPFGSTLLIRSRAFSLSTGHNKWSIDSLSLSFPKSLCLPDFARCQKKKTATSQSFWQWRAIKSKHSSWLSSTLSRGSKVVFCLFITSSPPRSVEGRAFYCSCARGDGGAGGSPHFPKRATQILLSSRKSVAFRWAQRWRSRWNCFFVFSEAVCRWWHHPVWHVVVFFPTFQLNLGARPSLFVLWVKAALDYVLSAEGQIGSCSLLQLCISVYWASVRLSTQHYNIILQVQSEATLVILAVGAA